MKKSLIALAVMAASGASFAQSSVTLYGIADVWVGSLKSAPGASAVTLLNSGGVSTSRWGLTGTEDLGGGLKAIFKFEQGVGVDTGAAAGFDRLSYVGLSGGFGEVTFGKNWTAIDDIMGASNSGFDSGLSATQGVWLTNNYYYQYNPNNAIKYTSPKFGGFDFAASYALDEKASASEDIFDFRVSYANGPMAANLGYQVQNGAVDTKITTVNGSFDFGMAKLLASYAQTKFASAKTQEYQIGVDVPLSSAMTLSAGYAYSDRNTDAAMAIAADIAADPTKASPTLAGSENTGFGVAVAYSLSKRTTLYGGFSSAKGEDAAGKDVAKRQLFAAGVKHTF